MIRNIGNQRGNVVSSGLDYYQKAIDETWKNAHEKFKEDVACYTREYNKWAVINNKTTFSPKQLLSYFIKRMWILHGKVDDLSKLTIYNFAVHSHGEGNSADLMGHGPWPEHIPALELRETYCFYTAHDIINGYATT